VLARLLAHVPSMARTPAHRIPGIHISEPIYSFVERQFCKRCECNPRRLAGRLQGPSKKGRSPCPEISVSYQAIKSKVYRLVDALVVGEKTESEVQVHKSLVEPHSPADRPIAQKYLLAVLADPLCP